MSAPRTTPVVRRRGQRIQAIVEPPAGPVAREQLVQMLGGAARILRTITTLLGGVYRTDLLRRIEDALRREGRVLLVLLALLVSGRGAAADETLARFAGGASVGAGCTSFAAVLSEDLPHSGFANRFRFVLTALSATCLEPGHVGPIPVRVAATSRGSMEVEISGWFRLEVIPGDPALQAALAAAAPGEETRMQWVTVTTVGPRHLQVLIEEPLQ